MNFIVVHAEFIDIKKEPEHESRFKKRIFFLFRSFLRKRTLATKLANFGLFIGTLHFIEKLDASTTANRAGTASVIRKFVESFASMCFCHIITSSLIFM